MAKNELDQARLDVQVERDLKVEISVAKPVGRPRRPGRHRRHDGRSARPSGCRRALDRGGRSVAPAAFQRLAAARSARSSSARPAPGPSPPRRPTRSGMHPPRRASPRPWLKNGSAWPPQLADAVDRNGVVEDLAKRQRELYAMANAPAARSAPRRCRARRSAKRRSGTCLRATSAHGAGGAVGSMRRAEGQARWRRESRSGLQTKSFGKRVEMSEAKERRAHFAEPTSSQCVGWGYLGDADFDGQEAANPRAVRRDRLLEPASSSPARTARPA